MRRSVEYGQGLGTRPVGEDARCAPCKAREGDRSRRWHWLGTARRAIYARYARVSTADQQSCERKIAELAELADRGGFEVVGIFKETTSGTRNNRHTRNRVLDLSQARRIDAALVTELSRWRRSTPGNSTRPTGG